MRLPETGSIEIVPSLLAADFSCLVDQVNALLQTSVRMVQWDIMDGHFVPNLSFGPAIVQSLRKQTELVFDIQLMVTDPAKFADQFVRAGADHITFHIETVKDPGPLIQHLRGLGVTVGIALNPDTPPSALEPFAHQCDMVLVMTVEPGFGGQAFRMDMLDKIRAVRRMIGHDLRLQVDGGINPQTAPLAVAAGADTLVAGHAVFGQRRPREAIQTLQAAVAGQRADPSVDKPISAIKGR